MIILLSFGSKHMLILISYDVETKTLEGKKRLRKISRICLKYGMRVQNSVFECHVNASQKILLHKKLQTQQILTVTASEYMSLATVTKVELNTMVLKVLTM